MLEKLFLFRWQLLLLLLGLILIASGVLINKGNWFRSPSVEIVDENENKDIANNDEMIIVGVSGSVNSPGVYNLERGSRIDDALLVAGGTTDEADDTWMDKYLNRASVLSDGQKIYIPSTAEQSKQESATESSGGTGSVNDVLSSHQSVININTASQSELESLWGIGPVTAQNIIAQRTYSSVEELLAKGILKSNVYERNKDLLSVY